MSDTDESAGRRKRPRWRKKWHRTPVERRSAAAEALGDLFDRRRADRVLACILAVSLVAHLGFVLLGPLGPWAERQALATEGAYLRTILSNQRDVAVLQGIARQSATSPAADEALPAGGP